MLTSPFLTDLDSRAAIRGSRDPLGAQPIWSRFGRQVIGNLTTVTTSARDFTTLILGYYFAERVANEHGGDDDLAVFLKWEQLAAYARGHVNRDWEFRGVHRASTNLKNAREILLGTDPAAQILSNQKIYGLWGLYTVAARSSGLLEGDPTRLTRAARDLVEGEYLPILARGGFRGADPIVELLARPKAKLDLEQKDRLLIQAVAKVLQRQMRSSESTVYREHLLLGGPNDRTHGAQAVLVEAISPTLALEDWTLSPATLRGLTRECHRLGQCGETVAVRLERIGTCEALLAPAEALFAHLLRQGDQKLASVAEDVERSWGGGVRSIDLQATEALAPLFQEILEAPEEVQRWLEIARSLAAGAYSEALRHLMEHNAATMRSRFGAAPWVEIQNGRIRVRIGADESAELPTRTELPGYWRNPYFIPSLRVIARQLEC